MVTLRNRIREVLRENYGSFNSLVEQQYVDRITEIFLESNDTEKGEWATYNQVILEFKKTLKNNLKVEELQYRLAESNDPKDDCIKVMTNYETFSPEMQRLYDKINLF